MAVVCDFVVVPKVKKYDLLPLFVASKWCPEPRNMICYRYLRFRIGAPVLRPTICCRSLCIWGDNCAYFLVCYCLLRRLLGVGGWRGGRGGRGGRLVPTITGSPTLQPEALYCNWAWIWAKPETTISQPAKIHFAILCMVSKLIVNL